VFHVLSPASSVDHQAVVGAVRLKRYVRDVLIVAKAEGLPATGRPLRRAFMAQTEEPPNDRTPGTSGLPEEREPEGADGAQKAREVVGDERPRDSKPVSRGRERLSLVIVCSLVAVLVLSGVLAYNIINSLSEPVPQAGCPSPDPDAAFTAIAKLEAGARVRAGASRDYEVIRHIPSGCSISFKGYCIGESVEDPAAHLPDVRWLFPADRPGFIASAITRGDVPQDMVPSVCPGQRQLPNSVGLEWSNEPKGALPERVQLVVRAPGADLVGLAAKYESSAEPDLRWRQIGITSKGEPFEMTWDLMGVQALQVPVVAVVCLAGEFPSEVLIARIYNMRGTTNSADTKNTVELVDADRAAARQAACRYPD
jgi:hypothetical protein